MPKPQLFHFGAAAVALLGLVTAVVAVTVSVEWGVALLALTVSGSVVTLVLADRRTLIASNRRAKEMRDLLRVVNELGGIHRDVRATSEKVDAMQRRIVASIDAARLEAADRQASARSAASD